MMHTQPVTFADAGGAPEETEEDRLDQVFFALSDPVRRAILSRLGGTSFLVSELAVPFDISVQAISRHIQVLVRAGLVKQERTGRISRCHLEVGPIYAAAVWINQYSEYWQAQFDALADWLEKIDARKPRRFTVKHKKKRVSAKAHKSGEKT